MSASNPKSGHHCWLGFSLRFPELNQLVGKFCWLGLFMFIVSLTSFHHQGLNSKFSSYLNNWQWPLGLTVSLVPSTPLCPHNAVSLGNVKTCSKPFSGCPFACQLSIQFVFQHLEPWEILTCISRLSSFCLLIVTIWSIQTFQLPEPFSVSDSATFSSLGLGN